MSRGTFAAALIAALEKGRIGENYILGGHNVMLKDMLAEIARLMGRKPPTLSLPRAPLYPLAYMSEALARITHKEPMLTVDALKMAQHKMFFSSAKAKRERRSFVERRRAIERWRRRWSRDGDGRRRQPSRHPVSRIDLGQFRRLQGAERSVADD